MQLNRRHSSRILVAGLIGSIAVLVLACRPVEKDLDDFGKDLKGQGVTCRHPGCGTWYAKKTASDGYQQNLRIDVFENMVSFRQRCTNQGTSIYAELRVAALTTYRSIEIREAGHIEKKGANNQLCVLQVQPGKADYRVQGGVLNYSSDSGELEQWTRTLDPS